MIFEREVCYRVNRSAHRPLLPNEGRDAIGLHVGRVAVVWVRLGPIEQGLPLQKNRTERLRRASSRINHRGVNGDRRRGKIRTMLAFVLDVVADIAAVLAVAVELDLHPSKTLYHYQEYYL